MAASGSEQSGERGRKSVGGVGICLVVGRGAQGSSASAALKRSTRGHCRRGRSYDPIERLVARRDILSQDTRSHTLQSDTCSRIFDTLVLVPTTNRDRSRYIKRYLDNCINEYRSYRM